MHMSMRFHASRSTATPVSGPAGRLVSLDAARVANRGPPGRRGGSLSRSGAGSVGARSRASQQDVPEQTHRRSVGNQEETETGYDPVRGRVKHTSDPLDSPVDLMEMAAYQTILQGGEAKILPGSAMPPGRSVNQTKSPRGATTPAASATTIPSGGPPSG